MGTDITIKVDDTFYHGTYDGFWFRSYTGSLVCIPLREHIEAGKEFARVQIDPEQAMFGGSAP